MSSIEYRNYKEPVIGDDGKSVVIRTESEDGTSWQTHTMDPISARLYAQRIIETAARIDKLPPRAWIERLAEENGRQRIRVFGPAEGVVATTGPKER